MKKILFCLTLLAVTSTVTAQEFNNVIKFNAFGAIVGQYQLGYERALSEKSTVQLSLGYITFTNSQNFIDDSYDSKTSGIIIIPEYRFYFAEAPVKFYVAPFARVRLVTEDLTDTSVPLGIDVSYTDKSATIGGGAVLGGQWVFAEAFSLDLFVGPQFKSKSTNRTYDVTGVTDDIFNEKFIDFKVKEKEGFGVRLGVNIGFAF